MKKFTSSMTTLVVGCLCAGSAWAAADPAPAAGAAGNNPQDGALADALGGSTVAGAGEAGTMAPAAASGSKTVSNEVVKYALARFDSRVAAYDNALVVVDAADANYRKNFNTHNEAMAAINAKIGGDRSNPMSYPDLQNLRDSSLRAAEVSLKELHTDAIAAENLYTALHVNPLFLYGYQETDYNKSRVDLGLFTKQLHWDRQVNPDLRYVQRRTGGTPSTTNAGVDIPTEAALADQLKPAVIQDFNALVTEYDGLVRDAINASVQSKQAQTAYAAGQKNRPTNTATRTVRVRSGRGWINRTLPNTPLDNWNNQQRATRSAQAAAESQLQNDRQEAAARYAFLKHYPLILSETYKFVPDKNMPELPLLERK